MNKLQIIILSMLAFFNNSLLAQPPMAPQASVVDEYYGVSVKDDYRYMENLDDPVVETWMKNQADYTRALLDNISGRERLINKMKEFAEREQAKITQEFITESDDYYYVKEEAKDEVGKLYFRNGETGVEKLLFDPENYEGDTGKQWWIEGFTPNYNHSLMMIAVASQGKEVPTLHILDLKSGELLPDKIERGSSFVTWLSDNKSFLYLQTKSDDVHSMESTLNSESRLHLVGETPEKDRVVFSKELYPELGIKPEEYPYVIYDRATNRLYAAAMSVERNMRAFTAPVSELKKEKIAWQQMFDKTEQIQTFDSDDEYIYLYSSKNADNYKLLRLPVGETDIAKAEEIIPNDDEWILKGWVKTKDGIYFSKSRNSVESKLFFRNNNGEVTEISLPDSAGEFHYHTKENGYKYSDVIVHVSGWAQPSKYYDYNLEANTFSEANIMPIPEYPEYEDLVVEEIVVPSHDGVEVPLSIMYKKGLKKDGNAPLYLYGYGSYGSSLSPWFSDKRLLWALEGGVIAIAHVRGGGEKGEQWRLAGKDANKPNTWKDFIASAEYLHANGYSSPGKTTIEGASAGGILIGRAITERPDLFAVAIPKVGCLNPLRQEFSPNGPVNVPEFGSVKTEKGFKALLEMDSFHHLKQGVQYPATLITAGFNDPRVIAWEPAKFAAKMQQLNGSENPILLRVDYEGGHFTGDTKSQMYQDYADVICFSFWQMGVPGFTLKNKPLSN